jgi:hypothetical protein
MRQLVVLWLAVPLVLLLWQGIKPVQLRYLLADAE